MGGFRDPLAGRDPQFEKPCFKGRGAHTIQRDSSSLKMSMHGLIHTVSCVTGEYASIITGICYNRLYIQMHTAQEM